MPDDQSTKPTTIDDLVKQLSNQNSPKPPVSNSPPPNLPGIKIGSSPMPQPPRPQMTMPPRPTTPPPLSNVPPKPSILTPPPPLAGGQVKPFSPAVPAAPTQEYKSSIRTMSEDISSVKSGQKPMGIDIPRKITPDQPRVGAVPTPAPMAGEPKPTGPAPQIGLGRTEKTASLPSIPGVSKGPIIAPGMPKLQTPQPQPPITAPAPKKSIGFPSMPLTFGRTTYFIVAGVLIVGGLLYWLLILRTTGPELVTSPIPSPTAVPTPVVKSLESIFEGVPTNFEVVQNQNVSQDFKTFVGSLSVTSEEFTKVSLVEDFQGTLVPINFLDMFDLSATAYPAGLRDSIVDSLVLVYGQSEKFNADGSIDFNAQGLKKPAYVAKVKDGTTVKAIMKDWELTVAKDLANYLLISATDKEASPNFLDNSYGFTEIRYKNFPSPDITIDYAIVINKGQDYLVISGSRQSMYAAIGTLIKIK